MQGETFALHIGSSPHAPPSEIRITILVHVRTALHACMRLLALLSTELLPLHQIERRPIVEKTTVAYLITTVHEKFPIRG